MQNQSLQVTVVAEKDPLRAERNVKEQLDIRVFHDKQI